MENKTKEDALKKLDDGTIMGMYIMMEGELRKRELIDEPCKPSVKGIKALMGTLMDSLKDM